MFILALEERNYRTRSIISRGLYIFSPSLWSRAVNIRNNLCSKQRNSSKQFTVYNLRAVSNQERVIMALVGYIDPFQLFMKFKVHIPCHIKCRHFHRRIWLFLLRRFSRIHIIEWWHRIYDLRFLIKESVVLFDHTRMTFHI